MKANMACRHFRHFGKDKVTMDFTFFAIALNIKELCAKLGKAERREEKQLGKVDFGLLSPSTSLNGTCGVIILSSRSHNHDGYIKNRKEAET